MEISKILKNKDGTFKFEGEVSPQEHEYILNVGLNTLLAQGAFAQDNEEEQEWPDDVSGESH